MALSSTVSFEAGKTYTIKGNGHKLTHGASYTGTLFTVPQNTTLTIEDLVIDGGNAWTLDETKWAAAKARSDSYQNVAVAELQDMVTSNGLNASGSLFDVTGSVTLKDTTVQNVYTSNSIKLFSVNSGASVTLGKGTNIQHCATVSCGNYGFVASYSSASFTIENGAVIQDMLGDCNGGLFALWGGSAQLTMNGGTIRNVKTVNSNGQLAMILSGSTMTMNGGTVENFVGLRGINNGKLGIIYMHGKGTFIMNGGTIRNNVVGPNGVVDATYVKTDYVELNGGSIVNNRTDHRNTTLYSVANQSPVKLGKNMVIDAPVYLTPYWDAQVTDEGDHSRYLGSAACRIGNVYYGTIADAATNAKDGDLITMVRDFVLEGGNYGTVVNKNITVDLNGKNLAQSRSDKPVFKVDNGIVYIIAYNGGSVTTAASDIGELSNGGQIIFVQRPAEEPSAAVPQTGDTTPLALLFAALALSGAGLLGLRKKARAR